MPETQHNHAMARRLARALQETVLELNGERGAEKIREELSGLLDLTRGEGGAFFESPVFGIDEKTAVLERLLEKRTVDPGLKRFLDVLVSLRSLELLPEILKAYDEAERERRNEVSARVRSAFPLDETDKKRLSAALSAATGKTVLMDVSTDPQLIGGVVAEIGSVVYDASIRGYLNRLEQEY